MRFLHSFAAPLLLLAAGAAQAAPSSWGFEDAKLTVTAKKTGAKEPDVRQFNDKTPALPTPVVFDSSDSLKIILTAKENGKGKRPHQAFLVLREPGSGLEAPFPLTVKDNGKATVEIKHSDLPLQLAIATAPLKASLVLASFGSSAGLVKDVFDVDVVRDPAAKPLVYEKPLRYGKRDEIHHIFRDDPKSPPKLISIVFVFAVLATVPLLLASWGIVGGNLSHLPTALSAAPVAHSTFLGSIAAMELVFFLYYSTWNLFQTLPFIGLVSVSIFFSGSKALGEVRRRRLAGER
ncbi:Oligosaccharyltransferase subunit Ribophorin II-domain-containing protein [Daldinia decipiens]|uniref:Oligosaccharyltransferase subunit Ribophorin II-domain-containing protein n=1 Tax=Daldinia decipiens TaxID=326647 RepID=UPI0020C3D642|nr:Oligosaccharyltransferase subunit Ribophorin II-domain-containing protein [Daldinia decipiens]KAI1656963.1 Oligosaccharyltransferase subunit Ribophorin II-domain-containing protein [Daldinia decipiens]